MKHRKKASILAIVISCLLVFSVTVFARAPICSNCNSGRIITTTRLETDSFMSPCGFGHGGTTDLLSVEYRNTYIECEECHYGSLTNSVQVSSILFCQATGIYYNV